MRWLTYQATHGFCSPLLTDSTDCCTQAMPAAATEVVISHNADVSASFSQFCRNKLHRVKDSISSTLSSWPFALVADPLPCVNDRSLAELSTVTDDEVEAAIKKTAEPVVTS